MAMLYVHMHMQKSAGYKCLAQESDGGDGVNAHGNSCVLDVLRDETRRQQSQVKRDGRLWL
jgi:hypothetical protein